MKNAIFDSLADLRPRGRSAALLTSVAFIDSIGTGVYLGGSAILFTSILGIAPNELGSALAAAGLVGIGASLAWAAGADRFGARRTLVILNVLRAIGFIGYLAVDDTFSFFAVTLYLGLLEKAMSPVMVAVVSAALEDKQRVHTLALIRSIRNVGFTLGTLLSSLTLLLPGRTSLNIMVVGNAATFVFAAVLLVLLPQHVRASEARRRLPGLRLLARRPKFMFLTGLNGVLSLHSAVLLVGIPLWTVHVLELPAPLLPVLIAINTVLTVLLQVRFSRGCEQPLPAARAFRRAGISLSAMALLIGISSLFPRPFDLILVIGGVLALTAAEMWQSAASWGVSLLISPDHARARFLTVFGIGTTGAEAVGLLLITGVLINAGWVGWITAGAVFFTVGILAARLVPGAISEAEGDKKIGSSLSASGAGNTRSSS